jgi:hypothetical protein
MIQRHFPINVTRRYLFALRPGPRANGRAAPVNPKGFTLSAFAKSMRREDGSRFLGGYVPAVKMGPPKSTASRAWGRGHEVAGINAFLTGSAPQTEFDVTHSKQTPEKILTGARMHIRISKFWPFTTQNLARVRRPARRGGRKRARCRAEGPRLHLNPGRRRKCCCTAHGARNTGHGPRSTLLTPFLTETVQQTEIGVTHSKQTTATILTETRIDTFRSPGCDIKRVHSDDITGSQCRNFLRLAFLRSCGIKTCASTPHLHEAARQATKLMED